MTKKFARSERILTPEFRVSFAHVFEPKAYKPGATPKYSIVMLFPKDADLSELKRILKETAVKEWGEGNYKDISLPLKSGDEKYNSSPEKYSSFKDTVFATATSMTQPGIVDRRNRIIEKPNEFYSGCYAWAKINAFAWDKGLSFGLGNIQKLNDGESLGGSSIKATEEFNSLDESTNISFDVLDI